MYNFNNDKDGYMDDEKSERVHDLEYGVSGYGYYSKESKDCCGNNNNKGNDHKEEKNCVIINIYCDNCNKESKKDGCKDNCKDYYRDGCKDNYKDGSKDDNKKENGRKDDKSCVIINIYCDKGK